MFDENDTRVYAVVVSHEEQYSLWPATDQPPAGWRPAGYVGAVQACMEYIDRTWIDMRPRSARSEAPE